MSWHLYQTDDASKLAFTDLQTKAEWFSTLGQLKIGQTNAAACNLLDEAWPTWIEATEHLSTSLRYLFKGELHPNSSNNDDPDVGFIGKEMVKNISIELSMQDAYFDELIEETELIILPLLRKFYADAANNGKAVIFILS